MPDAFALEDRIKRPLLLLGISERWCALPLVCAGLELEAYRIGEESANGAGCPLGVPFARDVCLNGELESTICSTFKLLGAPSAGEERKKRGEDCGG